MGGGVKKKLRTKKASKIIAIRLLTIILNGLTIRRYARKIAGSTI